MWWCEGETNEALEKIAQICNAISSHHIIWPSSIFHDIPETENHAYIYSLFKIIMCYACLDTLWCPIQFSAQFGLSWSDIPIPWIELKHTLAQLIPLLIYICRIKHAMFSYSLFCSFCIWYHYPGHVDGTIYYYFISFHFIYLHNHINTK